MNGDAGFRVAWFTALSAAVFSAAYWLGGVVGPVLDEPAPPHEPSSHSGGDHE